MPADGGWWFALLVVVLLTLVVAALVAAAIGLERRAGQASRPNAPGSAWDLLRRRYAAGELDDDEFRRRATTLRQHARETRPPSA